MGASVVAFTPAVNAVGVMMRRDFKLEYSRGLVKFSLNAEVKWVIDISLFDGRPQLRCLKKNGEHLVTLKGAYYPGTRLPADFSARIFRERSEWVMDINFNYWNIQQKLNFPDWLDGKKELSGKKYLNYSGIGLSSADGVELGGQTDVKLDNRWKLKLKGPSIGRLTFNNGKYSTNEIEVSLPGESLATDYGVKLHKASLIRLKGVEQGNTLFKSLQFKDGFSLNTTHAAASAAIVKGQNRKGDVALCFIEPLDKKMLLASRNAGQGNNIYLEDALLAVEYKNSDALFWVGAGFPAGLQLSTEKESLSLSEATPGQRSIEITGKNGEVEDIACNLRLDSSRLLVNDANSLPATYPNDTIVNVQFGNIQDDKKIKNLIKLDEKLKVVKFKAKDAIRLRIIRPEDLLYLNFEYHNFKYNSNDDQGTLLEVDNTNKKAYVIVYFQPQHTIEQAFFEVNDIPQKPGEAEGGETVQVPAKSCRSGRSRLVYEVDPDFEGIPLNMETLLDWSRFTLKVNHRARFNWMKNLFVSPMYYINRSALFIGDRKNKQQQIPAAKTKEKKIVRHNNLKVATKGRVSGIQIAEKNSLNQKFSQRQVAGIASKTGFLGVKNIFLKMGPPSRFDTAIEAPALLYISPNQLAAFRHSAKAKEKVLELQENIDAFHPKLSRSIVELWHTRLGVKSKDNTIDENSQHPLKTIRAIWGEDIHADYEKFFNPGDRPESLFAPRSALNNEDRHKIVHQTSNYTYKNFVPKPVNARRLMLSPLGAYLDLHVSFDKDELPMLMDLKEWEHRGTLGRDHYVKVVYYGFLYPFGHMAALVKVTERKFNNNTRSAANRQRMFIVVLEREQAYEQRYINDDFVEFPFRVVTINNVATPNIDIPAAFVSVDEGSNPESTEENDTIPSSFVVKVNGQPFMFNMTAIDAEGNSVDYKIPLVYVKKFIGLQNSDNVDDINTQYAGSPGINTSKLKGQKIAYAESFLPGDTEYETDSIQFKGTRLVINDETTRKFYPEVDRANVYIRDIEELTGDKRAVPVRMVDDDNKGKIFVRLLNSDGNLDFSGGSDKAGGFLSPNMNITSISKLQGPIGGDVNDMKDLNFNPADFFKAMDFPAAKLFGVIGLADLFDGVTDFGQLEIESMGNNIEVLQDEMYDLKSQLFDLKEQFENGMMGVQTHIDNLNTQIKNKVSAIEDALTIPDSKMPRLKSYKKDGNFILEYKWKPITIKDKEFFGILNFEVGNPAEALQITSKLTRPLELSGKLSLSTEARLNDFNIGIKDFIGVKFEYIRFVSETGKDTSVKVSMKDNPIAFQGALTFVNKLQSVIPSKGFSDGPYIKISPGGVIAGYDLAIPSIEVGVCTIANISLGAAIELPFTGAPLVMSFNFCKREAPFLLTVSMFGGGGFFLLSTRIDGVQRIEAAFEFGASVSLNLGVASGGVSIMGGFYFKMEVESGEESITLTGYIRMNGHLSVLGLISISVEFYLALVALIESGKVDKVYGEAKLKVKVKVAFFSKTVTMSVRRELKGADADPTFGDTIEYDDWNEYCAAFAAS